MTGQYFKSPAAGFIVYAEQMFDRLVEQNRRMILGHQRPLLVDRINQRNQALLEVVFVEIIPKVGSKPGIAIVDRKVSFVQFAFILVVNQAGGDPGQRCGGASPIIRAISVYSIRATGASRCSLFT